MNSLSRKQKWKAEKCNASMRSDPKKTRSQNYERLFRKKHLAIKTIKVAKVQFVSFQAPQKPMHNISSAKSVEI